MAEPGYKKLYQAPIPAVLAILIVFTWQGLGHFVMYMMDHYWFKDSIFLSSFIVGVVGVVMTWMGRNRSEAAATFLGFAGGSLIWLGWVEFSFVYVARDLGVEAVRWGAKDTLPEYRVMLSSAGVLFASLLFFFMNKDTRCNAFMWIHRNLRLNPGEKSSAQTRNVTAIVCMETIYVTWFCYIWLLVLYNPAFFGTDHWFTFVSAGFFAVWALYLAQRLWWFQRMAPALRYGIPTAIIGYNVVEILEKWGHMDEIWVQPQKYALPIGIAIAVLLTVVVLGVLSPARRVVDRTPSGE